MMSDRSNAICLLEVLREFSDAQHALPMREIIDKLNRHYGLKPDRRTIYSAVALLRELGYEISTYDENGKGYYLLRRDLDPSEVVLLMDAVHAFPFIPPTQSVALQEKLQKQLSVHQRKQYRHLRIVCRERKTENPHVFLNIEILDEAIIEKKQVSFTYLQYGLDKKLHPRRTEPYVVNPYGMVYMNERYYLICSLRDHPKTSLYRIDRIRDVQKLKTPRGQIPADTDQVQDAVYAFVGEPVRITMSCDKIILSDVLDKFGTDVTIFEKAKDRISISFTAPPDGVKFWALQYLPYVEVLTPKSLRDAIMERSLFLGRKLHRNTKIPEA